MNLFKVFKKEEVKQEERTYLIIEIVKDTITDKYKVDVTDFKQEETNKIFQQIAQIEDKTEFFAIDKYFIKRENIISIYYENIKQNIYK